MLVSKPFAGFVRSELLMANQFFFLCPLLLVNGLSNDSISTAGVCVQEHVKRYLKSEEEAMEEKIRRYTEEQKNQFAMVQSRAYNDKRAMLR